MKRNNRAGTYPWFPHYPWSNIPRNSGRRHNFHSESRLVFKATGHRLWHRKCLGNLNTVAIGRHANKKSSPAVIFAGPDPVKIVTSFSCPFQHYSGLSSSFVDYSSVNLNEIIPTPSSAFFFQREEPFLHWDESQYLQIVVLDLIVEALKRLSVDSSDLCIFTHFPLYQLF